MIYNQSFAITIAYHRKIVGLALCGNDSALLSSFGFAKKVGIGYLWRGSSLGLQN